MHFLEQLSDIVGRAFEACDLDPVYGAVRISDRPDLAQFQCNGALIAAKKAKKNPREIADIVAANLRQNDYIAEINIAGPGFLNINLHDDFIVQKARSQIEGEAAGKAPWKPAKKEMVVMDYGGPNVAKPLHVGHLRSAIIGESLKRIFRFVGDKVIADVHFGDWGLQMGQLISELEVLQPDLLYFDENITQDYPEESPVSLSDLEKLYPIAAANCKADKARMGAARKATFDLQEGRPGYRALWQHFVAVSRAAIEQEYRELDVSFDWWKGEADAAPIIPEMVEGLKQTGLAEESDGAWIIRVEREDDKKTYPPIMLITSEGSAGYHTTDIATIIDRKKELNPGRMLYVVDQRQGLHFEQVFRASEKAGFYPENQLEHLGFGTMNGSDGKPFKTREGGVLKLRDMIEMVEKRAHQRITESGIGANYDEAEQNDIAHKIGVAALKFADLSNPRTSDYIFDLDRFMAFEGKTGPYLLYASVRIGSILRKVDDMGIEIGEGPAQIIVSAPEERDLLLCLLNFGEVLRGAYQKRMPHILCDHGFALAQAFSKFYAACPVASEKDTQIQQSRIWILQATSQQLKQVLTLLGIGIPERM